MSQLLIVEASAGSGKTHLIVSKYLQLLFDNSWNFQHILAVTFTNKATEEMKSRLLSELHLLSQASSLNSSDDNISQSKFLLPLQEKYKLSTEQISKHSSEILKLILHNYSQFSIQTIDSFFQSIIQSFLRELNLSFNNRVELDIDWIINQAIDALMMNLDLNQKLFDWIINYIFHQMSEGRKWDIHNYLTAMGYELLSEKFLSLPFDYQEIINSPHFRDRLKVNELYRAKTEFENFLKKTAEEAQKIIDQYGLTSNDFKGKSRGLPKLFEQIKQNNFNISNYFKYDDYKDWPNSNSKNKNIVIEAAQNGLFEKYQTIVSYYNENLKYYQTILAIINNIHTYGVLADISASIDKVLSDNNLQLLSKSTHFLHEMIDNNDVSFLYERTGRIYFHFMIDEFQDTSRIQWENFRPLIKESLSNNYFSMVVGDVKQSIYRWRNTDWQILQSQAEADMKTHGVEHVNLNKNWRSLRNIVEFNNDFFGNYLYNNVFDDMQKAVYSNVVQQSQEDTDRKGMVSIDFFKSVEDVSTENASVETVQLQDSPNLEDKEQKSSEESSENINSNISENGNIPEDEISEDELNKIGKWVIDTILNILSVGYNRKDIAILVRTNNEGVEIVNYINEYNAKQKDFSNYINVLSGESMLLKSCIAVNIIIEAFQYIVHPDDTLNLNAIKYHYGQVQKIKSGNSTIIEAELPEDLIKNTSELLLLHPLELFERIAVEFHLNQVKDFIPYISGLHHYLQDFCNSHSALITEFLDYWELKKDKLSIELSTEQDAVRVLTIHKAKGLEFANVIIPFCGWKVIYSSRHYPILWCSAENTPLKELQYVPVTYSNNLINSQFESDYLKEKQQYLLDNINLLYVAFTRPMHHLFVCVPERHDESVGQYLYNYLAAKTQNKDSVFHFQLGQLENLKGEEKVNDEESYMLGDFNVYPYKGKIKQQAVHRGISMFSDTSQQFGNVMHRLFHYINYLEDTEKAVDTIIYEGLLPSSEREACILWITNLLRQESVSSWFARDWKVYSEETLIVPNGHPYRPDRVIVKGKQAIVVDYKFGKKELDYYRTQIATYMNLLKNMKYSPVQGFIWYVQLNKIEEVAR
jgi:ATP-dependent exoDNAse (exonuclease V) beta subunit